MSDLDNKNTLNSLNTAKVQPQVVTTADVKFGNVQVGSEESNMSTVDIIGQLVSTFKSGIPVGFESSIINQLKNTYNLTQEVAKACVDAAAAEIASKNKQDSKDSTMDKMNDWGKYQKQMLDMQNSANTQGGD